MISTVRRVAQDIDSSIRHGKRGGDRRAGLENEGILLEKVAPSFSPSRSATFRSEYGEVHMVSVGTAVGLFTRSLFTYGMEGAVANGMKN